ncbi:MAG TPA: HYR domain-containing protein [Planctomycetota bacterium]
MSSSSPLARRASVPLRAPALGLLLLTAPLAAQAATTRLEPDGALLLGGSCDRQWLPTFGREPGANGEVLALVVHDDGSGPALYVGGEFTSFAGVTARGIARWDGTSWMEVGGGVDGAVEAGLPVRVSALTVHDDGGGPKLYAGGHFARAGGVTVHHVARWDGAGWSALGTGVEGGNVHALAVHDDGGGPALYAGGSFTLAGGVTALRTARWKAGAWSALQALSHTVRAFAVYDSGGGPLLHAGGDFTNAGLGTVRRVARLEGTTWTALANGVNGSVHALAVHDDGSGPALYAGGAFTTANGAPANRIARWNGAWSAVGAGTDGPIHALRVHDEGGGTVLLAGGAFTSAGGVAADSLARWDGAGWAAHAPGLATTSAAPPVRVLASFDDGNGMRLYAGGALRSAGALAANRIARWDGASWSVFGSGIDDSVRVLLVHDDGGGQQLYAGGSFTDLAGVPASRIARWDGTSWSPLGSGVGTDGSILASEVYVSALAVHDDGSGPALYAGGNFTTAGGGAASRIARWDGASWAPLGTGMDQAVEALASFDDGSGPALFAGGSFTSAGGVAASRIARWNGASWTALGTGVSGSAPLGVASLLVHDDGSGPALYVGGHFEQAGGVLVNHIARWNGAGWSGLAGGMTGAAVPEVTAMVAHASGGPPQLHATGLFSRAGGNVAVGIARWNGASWAALGTFPFFGRALAVHDDGAGPRIHAGAEYSLGGVTHAGTARWTGANWQLLGGDMLTPALDLAVFDDGHGPALFAAGGAVDSADSYLAKWGDPDRTAPVLACPTSLWVLDAFGSPAGESVSFTVTASDDCDPAPVVVCVPPSGSVFPHGTTLVTCTATDAAGNQATCQFPVTVAFKARQR